MTWALIQYIVRRFLTCSYFRGTIELLFKNNSRLIQTPGYYFRRLINPRSISVSRTSLATLDKLVCALQIPSEITGRKFWGYGSSTSAFHKSKSNIELNEKSVMRNSEHTSKAGRMDTGFAVPIALEGIFANFTNSKYRFYPLFNAYRFFVIIITSVLNRHACLQ